MRRENPAAPEKPPGVPRFSRKPENRDAPEKPVNQNQNKPQIRRVRKMDIKRSINLGVDAGGTVEVDDENQQTHKPLPQASSSVNEPIIEECGEIICGENLNMGTNSGFAIIKAKTAPKGKRAPN